MGDSDKVKDFLDDCRKSKIDILPPSISHSGWEFDPCGPKTIQFGFGAIKGTGQKAVESLVAKRDEMLAENQTLGLHDLANEVDPHDVGKVCWEALIKAGSFDENGHNRGAVLAAVDQALKDASGAAADRRSGQVSMFDAFGAGEPEKPEVTDDGIDDSKSLSKAETLALEFEVLGFYLSGHPLEERAGLVSLLSSSPITSLNELEGGTKFALRASSCKRPSCW